MCITLPWQESNIHRSYVVKTQIFNLKRTYCKITTFIHLTDANICYIGRTDFFLCDHSWFLQLFLGEITMNSCLFFTALTFVSLQQFQEEKVLRLLYLLHPQVLWKCYYFLLLLQKFNKNAAMNCVTSRTNPLQHILTQISEFLYQKNPQCLSLF